MAVYENLPVFKCSYNLLLYMYKVCANLNKLYRYNVGDKITGGLVVLMTDVYEANRNENKVAFLEDARKRVVSVRLYVRLLYDSKQIPLKKFAYISEQMESISKQLSAWRKKSEKRNISKL